MTIFILSHWRRIQKMTFPHALSLFSWTKGEGACNRSS
ncbi:hypothetical protein LEMLEM_LOCUS13177 [Lemmus lemmus]